MKERLALLAAGFFNLIAGPPKVPLQRGIEYATLADGRIVRVETLTRPDGYGRILDLQFVKSVWESERDHINPL